MVGVRMPFHQLDPFLLVQLPRYPAIAFRSDSRIARSRYFGTNTPWYLQYHLTYERLCHSLITVSFLVNLTVHIRETVLRLHAETAEPFRVAPPEAVVYLNANYRTRT